MVLSIIYFVLKSEPGCINETYFLNIFYYRCEDKMWVTFNNLDFRDDTYKHLLHRRKN